MLYIVFKTVFYATGFSVKRQEINFLKVNGRMRHTRGYPKTVNEFSHLHPNMQDLLSNLRWEVIKVTAKQ